MYGIKLKELREERGLTQEELADFLNSTQKQISKWETERIEPNIFWLCKLAKFYNVSVDFILGLEDENNNIEIHNSFNNNSGNINFRG